LAISGLQHHFRRNAAAEIAKDGTPAGRPFLVVASTLGWEAEAGAEAGSGAG